MAFSAAFKKQKQKQKKKHTHTKNKTKKKQKIQLVRKIRLLNVAYHLMKYGFKFDLVFQYQKGIYFNASPKFAYSTPQYCLDVNYLFFHQLFALDILNQRLIYLAAFLS